MKGGAVFQHGDVEAAVCGTGAKTGSVDGMNCGAKDALTGRRIGGQGQASRASLPQLQPQSMGQVEANASHVLPPLLFLRDVVGAQEGESSATSSHRMLVQEARWRSPSLHVGSCGMSDDHEQAGVANLRAQHRQMVERGQRAQLRTHDLNV